MFIRSESKKKEKWEFEKSLRGWMPIMGIGPWFFRGENAWQLLLATILGAQCTDARVNMVTESFLWNIKIYKPLQDCDLKSWKKISIPPVLYHNKAKNMKACAKALVEEYLEAAHWKTT